jgi:transposase
MAQGKSRDPRKEQQWRRWIQQWQQSRLSVRDFCVRYDLAEATFYAWRRQLQQQESAAAFVPVRVVPDEAPAADSLEVVLDGGRRVRVAPGFDPATLRQLLAVLEEVPPC